jgi:hypothetical protein
MMTTVKTQSPSVRGIGVGSLRKKSQQPALHLADGADFLSNGEKRVE